MDGYGCFYIKDGRVLVTRQDGIPHLTLPLKIDSDDITEFAEMLGNEFQIKICIHKLLEIIPKTLVQNDKYSIVNTIIYHIKEYEDYEYKYKYTLKESGEYTEKKFISLSEAKELYKKKELSEDTMMVIIKHGQELGLK